MSEGAILQVTGRALPLRGDDIDTDRIMPARFLKAITFKGLEAHLFEDDRASMPGHPLDDIRFAGATVLLVNRNFKGRQGSPTGRTLLMSPAMVAAAAIAGEVVDVRHMLRPEPAVQA